MNLAPPRKEKSLYKYYALAIVSFGYVLGELGHFLIGEFIYFYSYTTNKISTDFTQVQNCN